MMRKGRANSVIHVAMEMFYRGMLAHSIVMSEFAGRHAPAAASYW
jgi:hypothetical protein